MCTNRRPNFSRQQLRQRQRSKGSNRAEAGKAATVVQQSLQEQDESNSRTGSSSAAGTVTTTSYRHIMSCAFKNAALARDR